MTQLPSLEGRIRAQEGMSTIFHARLEDIAQDMATSFKQVVDYHVATEHQLDARFNQVDARLSKIEATMATKEDIASLDGRIVTLEQRFTSLENKFDQVLQMVAALTKKIAE